MVATDISWRAPLISMPEIAEIAAVQRPVVTTWRRRHATFPSPAGATRTQPLFDAREVAEWHLHPDAYLVLATPAHQDCWWLEIDQDTESLPRIKRKCRTYLDFLTHGGVGPDGVPPRILFTTPDLQ